MGKNKAEFFTYGNTDILKQRKTAFLCSRQCPANIILKTYDWAVEQREKGICVISGFHSQIEKDVLHYLIKGEQPIIMALGRGMKKRWEPGIRKAVRENRLLIITPFAENVTWVTRETACKRNRLMVQLADEIFIAHASPGGNLEKLLREMSKGKRTRIGFDRDEKTGIAAESDLKNSLNLKPIQRSPFAPLSPSFSNRHIKSHLR